MTTQTRYGRGIAGVRQYLSHNGSITQREACLHLAKMAGSDLTKHIHRLRSRGMPIEEEQRVHPTSRKRYTCYHFKRTVEIA